MIVQLTDKKADKILQFCLYFSPEGKAFTIREVASLIGSLISSCPGVEYGRLRYRSIERDKIIALKASKGNFETKMLLSGESREELQWWIQNVIGISKFTTWSPKRSNFYRCICDRMGSKT